MLGSRSWKHCFFLSGLTLFPLHFTFCSMQRRALLIHTDIGLLCILSGLHNCLLDFHFSPLPVCLIASLLTLKLLVCPSQQADSHSRGAWGVNGSATQGSLFSSLRY